MRILVNLLLIVISPPVFCEVLEKDDLTEDWRGKATICHVHQVKLTTVKAHIQWGFPAEESLDDPRMERYYKFPYSKNYRVFGGCCITDKLAKYALIHHCSECSKQANQWIIENVITPKHKRPISPKMNRYHTRILRELQKTTRF
jgi:hypothetical protein